LTTSITLVLGVACSHQPHSTIVLTGLAGLFAGASSMACGEWLSARAEQDTHIRELAKERWHLQTIPQEEAAHMKAILQQYGLRETTADAINADLAALPIAQQAIFHGKFELGLDVDEAGTAPWRNALAMWFFFVLGAFIPLCPWLWTTHFNTACIGSAAGSFLGLVAISVYQARGHCQQIPGTLLRQIIITSIAVGVTIVLDMWSL
jgi:VIT1/CCC1 family predicted Fe2+/Mn2+ transporter